MEKSTIRPPHQKLADPPYRLGPTFTRALSLWNPLDYLRILYWVFFHPQWIRDYVKWLAPDYPRKPQPSDTWALIKTNIHTRALIVQAFIMMIIFPFIFTHLLQMIGVPIKYDYVLLGIIGSVLLGLAAGAVFGVTFGTVLFVSGGVTFGLSFSVVGGVMVSAGVSIARGAVGGAALGLTFSVALGVSPGFLAKVMTRGATAGAMVGAAYGMTVGMAYSIAVDNIYGMVLGAAVGLAFVVFYTFFLSRLPFYIIGVILGISRKKKCPHPMVKLDGTIWLPFPGIRREIFNKLNETPAIGVQLCAEYIKYSFQFIPVIQALNDVLTKNSSHGHYWNRLLLQVNRIGLIRYGTISLCNSRWYSFLLELFIIPRCTNEHWFPTSPWLDSPARAVCAGYYSIAASIIPTVEPIEKILASLDKSIDYFLLAAQVQHSYEAINSYIVLRAALACETTGEIGVLTIKPPLPLAEIKKGAENFAWLDSLSEVELRPELLYALRELRSVAIETRILTEQTSRVRRLAATARASDTLRILKDYVSQECFEPEKTLLGLIIHRWTEIITKAGGEVGRSALPIDKIPNNYIIGPALRDQKGRLFVGRDDIYHEVTRLWSNEQLKQTVVFYGQRRMGKTSILLHMESNLDAQYLPIFLDMQTLATVTSHGAFLYNLADKIASELNKKGLVLTIPTRSDYTEEPFIAFRKFIEAAEEAIPPDKWAVLMIDEFEKVEEKLNQGAFPLDLMHQFRNIMQHHPRFVLVFAGSHLLEEMRQDYWSPLLNIAHVIKVGYLS
ncbi:MAG: ATP-binding protein, partial [Acidobacteria bacterium]|nr:ATP-binding protein [Acidobacteriota bacterium]